MRTYDQCYASVGNSQGIQSGCKGIAFDGRDTNERPETLENGTGLVMNAISGCQGVGRAGCRTATNGVRGLLRGGDEAADAGATVTRGRGRGGRCSSSFIPGTLVLMADGRGLPIEQVRVGDRVIAIDPETGRRSARRVTREISSVGQSTS